MTVEDGKDDSQIVLDIRDLSNTLHTVQEQGVGEFYPFFTRQFLPGLLDAFCQWRQWVETRGFGEHLKLVLLKEEVQRDLILLIGGLFYAQNEVGGEGFDNHFDRFIGEGFEDVNHQVNVSFDESVALTEQLVEEAVYYWLNKMFNYLEWQEYGIGHDFLYSVPVCLPSEIQFGAVFLEKQFGSIYRLRGSRVDSLYDSLAPFYDVIADAGIKTSVFTHLVKMLGEDCGMILDLGSGTGALHEHVLPSSRVIGVDLSLEMLFRAKGDRAQATVLRLPFPNEGFSNALMSFGVHLVEAADMKVFFDEVRRVLIPGGKFVFNLARPNDHEKDYWSFFPGWGEITLETSFCDRTDGRPYEIVCVRMCRL